MRARAAEDRAKSKESDPAEAAEIAAYRQLFRHLNQIELPQPPLHFAQDMELTISNALQPFGKQKASSND